MSDLIQPQFDKEVSDEFMEFYRSVYAEEITDLLDDPSPSSLTMDYEALRAFDQELADGLVTNPHRYFHTARRALQTLPEKDENKQLHSNLPYDEDENPFSHIDLRVDNNPNKIPVRLIRAEDVANMVTVEGRVKKQTEVKPRIDIAAYQCSLCSDIQYRKQPLTGNMEDVGECAVDNCGGTPILDWQRSHKVNFERITVEEAPEDLKGGETPQSIDVYVRGDITGMVSAGERVTVTGILEPDSDNDSSVFNTYLRGHYIEREEEDYDELTISDEDIETIKEIANSDDVYDKIRQSIAPAIYGYPEEKLALAFGVFGGVKKTDHGSYIRGDIHVLLVGDPGTGKSQLVKYTNNISPRGVYTSGKNSSSAGLTATAVQDETLGGEKAWTLEAGALVLADKGVAAIDELDKMSSEDRGSLHEALESQEISVSKAGINATLKSRCSLLAAANPKYGRFDEFEPIPEQIELDPALISRFDLMFTITDDPSEEHDSNIAEHVLAVNQSQYSDDTIGDREEEDIEPEIPPELFRKYVAYARKNCHPEIPNSVAETLREYYVQIRNDSDSDAIPITARKLQGLVRLAEASARMRLDDEIREQDAERAIEITRSSLEDVGLDPETGELDADRVESGTTSSQRDRIRLVQSALSELEDEEEESGVSYELLLDTVEQHGLEEHNLKDILKKLRDQGDVYKPSNDRYAQLS